MSIRLRRESAEITAEISAERIDAESVGRSALLIDSYDSFTHNIAHALREAGCACEVVRHDEVTVAELLAADVGGWVLGPGPCTPEQAGIGLALVKSLVVDEDERPFLGICLGHQTLAVALGGRVRRATRAVHGRRVRMMHDGTGVLEGLASPIEVTRYNSLVVDETTLPAPLLVTARDEDGEIMGLRHRRLPLEGVQFHPESWLDDGARGLFASWVDGLRA